MSNNNQIQIFQTSDGQVQLDVALQNETVWLSQRQLADLFDKDVRTVSEHIKNIYQEQELTIDSTVRKFRIVRQEGQREVSRNIEHYNLGVNGVRVKLNGKSIFKTIRSGHSEWTN